MRITYTLIISARPHKYLLKAPCGRTAAGCAPLP